jgi:hypothetical protein
MRWLTVLFVLLMVAVVSCKKDEPRSLTSIEVSAPTSMLRTGDSINIQAVGKDASGGIMTGIAFTWNSSDPATAVVNNGIVKGLKAGNVSITASSGNVTGSINLVIKDFIAGDYINSLITIGTDVSPVTSSKIKGFYSALGFASKASSDSLPLIKNRKENLVVAVDNNNNVVTLGFVKGNDAKLDVELAGISLVRFVMNPSGTGQLDNTELSTLIKNTPSFADLKISIQQGFGNGILLLENDDVLKKAVTVGHDALIKKGELIAGRMNANLGGKEYYIDGFFSGENLWFEDVPGQTINFINDTRLYWQVTSKKESGDKIETQILDWRPFKFVEFLTFLNPPTEKKLTVLGDGKFSVTVEQTNDLRTRHFLHLMQQGFHVLLEGILKKNDPDTKDLECALKAAQGALTEKFPELLYKGSKEAAFDYIKSVIANLEGDWLIKMVTKCAPDIFNVENITTTFAQKIFKIWFDVQWAVRFGTFTGYAAQVYKYWDFKETRTFCKKNGELSKCINVVGTYQLVSCRGTAVGSEWPESAGMGGTGFQNTGGKLELNEDGTYYWELKYYNEGIWWLGSHVWARSTDGGRYSVGGHTDGKNSPEASWCTGPHKDVPGHGYCSQLPAGTLMFIGPGGESVMLDDGVTIVSAIGGQTVWKKQ